MLNITAVGRLGKDPELRTTSKGQEVTGFSLGVNTFANGEKQTIWLKCSVWGKRGEALRNYCQKGSQITINGSLSQNSWVDKEGETVVDLAVNVTEFSLPAREKPQADTGACPMPAATASNDEIPF